MENKIPNVNNLVKKKTDYNTKVTEIENRLNINNHDKYIDTLEFNKLATDVFNARLVQANLVTKIDFDAKLLSLNRKITSNKTKTRWIIIIFIMFYYEHLKDCLMKVLNRLQHLIIVLLPY